jgi:hypothetical protein
MVDRLRKYGLICTPPAGRIRFYKRVGFVVCTNRRALAHAVIMKTVFAGRIIGRTDLPVLSLPFTKVLPGGISVPQGQYNNKPYEEKLYILHGSNF